MAVGVGFEPTNDAINTVSGFQDQRLLSTQPTY